MGVITVCDARPRPMNLDGSEPDLAGKTLQNQVFMGSGQAPNAFQDDTQGARPALLHRHGVVQGQAAAIGIEGLAGHVGGILASQEDGDAADLRRLAEAA